MFGKWMHRGADVARVVEEKIQEYLDSGYVVGRPFRAQPPKERARRSVPHLTNRKLLRDYGISYEIQRAEREAGNKWCTFHKRYEPVVNFHQRCKECKDGKREIQRGQYQKHGRDRKYNVPKDWRPKMLKFQGGHCALCPAVSGDSRKGGSRLFIDHDHSCCSTPDRSCGKCVRGLLCNGCNAKIGYLEGLLRNGIEIKNPDAWTIKALDYLATYSVQLSPKESYVQS